MCLAIMLYLTAERGWPIIAFALGGFLLSAAYTAPPLRLKKHGLGEPTVVVVWGPLMVGRRLLRGHRARSPAPCSSQPALRDPVHDGAHGQAHRQGAVGRSGRHPHAARSSSATARLARSPAACSSSFYAMVVGLAIARILPVATVLVFASMPHHGAGLEGVRRAQAGRVAVPEPGLAAVVRAPLVPA